MRKLFKAFKAFLVVNSDFTAIIKVYFLMTFVVFTDVPRAARTKEIFFMGFD